MTLSGKNYKRIVIKVGSSLFYSKKESLDIERLSEVVCQVAHLLKNEGKEIVVVSSGAIALGMDVLGLKSRPKALPILQAAAAIGQNVLMDSYGFFLKKAQVKSAQILLTWDDFNDRKRYLNAKNTLQTLLKLGSVPIINENDTVSTDEIKFGDNDRLSAMVSALISADLLIILSDFDGLLDEKKNVIPVVSEINHQVKALACPTTKRT
ncbi:MAG: glutamate 5-kinase, partial [Candidatus Omnitrophica bacterium]|nr:glutamate 5-kinase [Candidatus Omnitrophota bacterium]